MTPMPLAPEAESCVDFSSQDYFCNPAPALEKLRSAGQVVEVRFPIVGKVWMTTTRDLTDQVLAGSETFT